MNKRLKVRGAVWLWLILMGMDWLHFASAQPRVQLNGYPLATAVEPIRRGYRILVPMREIFEALGATVNWNPLTQEITAQRGAATVRLQIGNAQAMVTGEQVTLDQPAMLHRGVTMVPLRFVAEALGADVHWNEARQMVSIDTKGVAGEPASTVTGRPTITVPGDAVVPVTINAALSSGDAHVGDKVTVTVQSRTAGDSEFPAGSKIEAVVSAVERRTNVNPGVLDLDFRTLVMPEGTRYALRGQLTALDEKSVQTVSPGRLMVTNSLQGAVKIVGLGAGVGYALGHVLRKNGVVTSVVDPTGRALYRQGQDKNMVAEAVVSKGTVFGVRLTHSVAYVDSTGYAAQRQQNTRTP